jgi:uncharacterized protein (DUF1501 family)
LTASGEGTVRTFGFAANLLAALWGTRVVWLTLPGYDNHAGQRGPNGQDGRLAELDIGLHTFWSTLPAFVARDTVVYVWTEFGRRFKQNSSHGTDHGAGGLAILEGPRVRGGVMAPSSYTSDLDGNGNVRVSTDRRSVQAELVRHLGADPVDAVGRGIVPTDLLGPTVW